MTVRYTALADGTVRGAYERPGQAAPPTQGSDRRRRQPLVPDPGRLARSHMLNTRVAHGYYSRHLAAEGLRQHLRGARQPHHRCGVPAARLSSPMPSSCATTRSPQPGQ